MRWFALAALCGCGGQGFDYPLDDVLRASDMQVVGTHNSYHVQTADHPAWEYTHAALDVQIVELGVRQFELDMYWNDDNGEYDVLHVPFLDEGTTCATLQGCVAAQAAGASQVPGHVPMLTLLEVKDPIPDSAAEPRARLAALDAAVRAPWDDDQVLTPAEVQGRASTLAESVSGGWPLLDETRGRMIYVLHAGDAWRRVLTDDDASVGETALFAEAGGDLSCSACAVQTINDPASESLAPALAAGMLVRTRADADSEQARDNDTSLRDRAMESGAHFVSSDWPAPHPDTGYVVSFGTPARCNPVTAPPQCTDDALERP
jgi:hypothetical protein